jgi:nucleotide-binding universal stress UspA family protein
MFEKILYPTDFSEVSKKALDYIKQLKESGAKEVVLLHVMDQRGTEALHRFMEDSKIQELKKNRKNEATKLLMSIEKELKEAGLAVKSRIETGIPVREILRVEKEEDVSVMVIGSHGMSNLEEMFLGSVSEKVIRKCPKPVLVIKR